jgi:hypothetical protein
MNNILGIYDRFKHLDAVLSDAGGNGDNPTVRVASDLWLVVKDYAENKCVWRQDDEGNWFADDPCSAGWQFITGGPSDNDMSFCPVCGRPLEMVPYKNEEVDDE